MTADDLPETRHLHGTTLHDHPGGYITHDHGQATASQRHPGQIRAIVHPPIQQVSGMRSSSSWSSSIVQVLEVLGVPATGVYAGHMHIPWLTRGIVRAHGYGPWRNIRQWHTPGYPSAR